MFGWWGAADEQVDAEFDEQAYRRYAVDQRAHSDLVRRDVFRCHPFVFKFRYVLDERAGRCCSVVDFCKGLKISHDLLQRCNFDRQHVRQLNELVLGAPPAQPDFLGGLFATKHGLVQLLQRFSFANKNEVLLAVGANEDHDRDNLLDKIEAVLNHVKTLNTNSDKFVNAHKSFKLEVGARFEQFEQRLQTLDTKLNALQCAAPTRTAPGVVFPRDVTKHPHLAVFMGRVENRGVTQIAFARGQEEHFRKRKLEFEEGMDVMFEGVHPNPLLAVHCIKEEFANGGHKIRRLPKKVIEVDCAVNVAKDIVKKAILNKT